MSGSPAKQADKRFSDDIIARLLKTKWWDEPMEVLKQLSFDDIEACLEQLEQDTMLAPNKTNKENDATKLDKLNALQDTIDTIISSASQPLNADRQIFSEIIKQKLDAISADQLVIDFVQENASRLYHKYDVSNPYDQTILNNKLLYVLDITKSVPAGSKLPKSTKEEILLILCSKE